MTRRHGGEKASSAAWTSGRASGAMGTGWAVLGVLFGQRHPGLLGDCL
jgi:hypothetical protein